MSHFHKRRFGAAAMFVFGSVTTVVGLAWLAVAIFVVAMTFPDAYSDPSGGSISIVEGSELFFINDEQVSGMTFYASVIGTPIALMIVGGGTTYFGHFAWRASSVDRKSS